ncbi:hypothetical protein AB4876_08990 [Zhongshania guokunii]|uniref:Uncharacterized protein n=1 Tax=Zhongshania guokunii TaxID=641783 RepID=A0ABV3U512_9GAMM
MNISQTLFGRAIQHYGAQLGGWPRMLWPLLGLLLLCSRRRRQQWQLAQREAEVENSNLLQDYADGMSELSPSDTLQRRLQAIAAHPQLRSAKAPNPLPFWRISLASAMASALLGLVLGAGGMLDEFSDSDSVYLESAMNYEVSNWLAGDIQ